MGREEIRAPLKTPAREATATQATLEVRGAGKERIALARGLGIVAHQRR